MSHLSPTDLSGFRSQKIELQNAIVVNNGLRSHICDVEDRYSRCDSLMKIADSLPTENLQPSGRGGVLQQAFEQCSTAVAALEDKKCVLQSMSNKKEDDMRSQVEAQVDPLRNIDVAIGPNLEKFRMSMATAEEALDEEIARIREELSEQASTILSLKKVGDDLQCQDVSLGERIAEEETTLRTAKERTVLIQNQLAVAKGEVDDATKLDEKLRGSIDVETADLENMAELTSIKEEIAQLEMELEAESKLVSDLTEQASRNEALVADVSELNSQQVNASAELIKLKSEIEKLTREKKKASGKLEVLVDGLPKEFAKMSETELAKKLSDEDEARASDLNQKRRKVLDLENYDASSELENDVYDKISAMEQQIMRSSDEVQQMKTHLEAAILAEEAILAKSEEEYSLHLSRVARLEQELSVLMREIQHCTAELDPDSFVTPVKKAEQPNAIQTAKCSRDSSEDEEGSSYVASVEGIAPFSPDSLRMKEELAKKRARLEAEGKGGWHSRNTTMETDDGALSDFFNAKPAGSTDVSSHNLLEDSIQSSSGQGLSSDGGQVVQGTNDLSNRFPANIFLDQTVQSPVAGSRSSPSAQVSTLRQDFEGNATMESIQSVWD